MISHDHKLIFIHIPKCGGRSICDIFNQRFDHFTANYYIREYSEYWNRYDKFTIVRNPYARLVSIYHYIKEHRRHSFEPIGFEGKMPDFKTWLIKNINHYSGDFYKHSAEGMRGTDGDLGSPFWFSSQFRRLSSNDGKIYANLKLFKLEEGMQPVTDWLQEVTGKYLIPLHINKSAHEPFIEYYDEELIELINYCFEPINEDVNNLFYAYLQT